MRKAFSALVVALILGRSGAVHAGDFQKGLKAYAAGDYATAFREWRDLVEQGDAEAQSYLGLLHGLGLGVAQNNAESMKWSRLAAEQGNADAQSSLGMTYYYGRNGVAVDEAEAMKWCRLAAEQGDTHAQSILGTIYREGQGVIQDFVSAHMWFNIAVASGYSDAARRRDFVAKTMTPADISKAQKLAREWMEEHQGQ